MLDVKLQDFSFTLIDTDEAESFFFVFLVGIAVDGESSGYPIGTRYKLRLCRSPLKPSSAYDPSEFTPKT